MVPHVSPSSRTGSNGGYDLSVFVLAITYKSRPYGSHGMWHVSMFKTDN